MRYLSTLCLAMCCCAGALGQDAWEQARENGEAHRRALLSCWRHNQGWLQYADEATGLLPRRLDKDHFWNAQDCAADNYPFMTLTAFFTDKELLHGKMRAILDTEQRLCNRVDRLPDDFDFATQGFRNGEIDMAKIIFGASEYVKDGLTPLTEWMGPSPWSDRMLGLVDDIWKHAEIQTEVGLLPTVSHEVAGELMQSMSRIYWMTAEPRYKEWTYRLASYFLEYHSPIAEERLSLDDHGCEVISGLSEAYYIAAKEDPDKRALWKPALHAILDCVLEKGADENGMLYMAVNPVTGEVLRDERTDNWGYNYLAFVVVAELDDVPRYRDAIQKVLDHLGAYKDYPWEGARPDGFADSLEGCLDLINRYPSQAAEEWADYTFERHIALQRDTGIFEGWYGDGNSARTFIMYALWKSQGVWAEPWHADVRPGAVREEDGGVCVTVQSDWGWTGKLRFDRPRHAEGLHIPSDYARLNQFPEWFTAAEDARYTVSVDDAPGRTLSGEELQAGIPLHIEKEGEVRVRVTAQPQPL